MIEAIAEEMADKANLLLGTNLFISFMPDTPTQCCALYQYQGPKPGLEIGTGKVVEEILAIQFVCRGKDYEEVSDLVDRTFYSLCLVNEFELIPLQNPFFLGWENNYCKFSFNTRAMKRTT
jgi:hypothetical protein